MSLLLDNVTKQCNRAIKKSCLVFEKILISEIYYTDNVIIIGETGLTEKYKYFKRTLAKGKYKNESCKDRKYAKRNKAI